jgi:hypothetical protein
MHLTHFISVIDFDLMLQQDVHHISVTVKSRDKQRRVPQLI